MNVKTTKFSDLTDRTWNELLAADWGGYQPPLTVHLPIQPLHSPDFIHVDAGLNVCRRRVYPNLSNSDRASYQQARERETFVVQLALDDPPFIPDFCLSTMQLAEGKYPVAEADYFACDLYYQFAYACRAVDEKQSLLWIRGTVSNEKETSQTAHVRVKINFQRECDLFDYHYLPFHWDNTKWLKCTAVSLEGRRILKAERAIGKIADGGFPYRWEKEAGFADADYNKRFKSQNCFVAPALRLNPVQDVIHFQGELKPGERQTFAIALLTNYEAIEPEHIAALNRANWREDRDAALAEFKNRFGAGQTSLVFPQDRWDAVFTELQLSTLQLLVRFPGHNDLMPTQGGSSERFFVWVWEAVFMLLPMLRLGHFLPVRNALDFIFALQDAGCPPEGHFTTTEGSIGTTGPKWMNSTGSALALAADYYLYSGDAEFLKTYLPKMVKAAGWIVGEIRATRKLSPDGTRPPYYGLMPFGCATDGDIGYIVAFTDAFTFWGLEKAVRLLEAIQYERAGEFRSELETYRRDIDHALRHMTRKDGYIERKIMSDEAKICKKFENTCSALQFAYTGNIDVNSEVFSRFVAYFENNLMEGFFTGHMDREIAYMGTGEYIWQHTYLRLGEWKKAFAAMQTNFRYGMTPDTLQVQERFSRRNPAFTPWQPNGSGNGRMLDMMLNSLYFEHDGVATLLGGIPFAWLAANETTAIKNLYTHRGRLNLEAKMSDTQNCRLVLSAADKKALPRLVRIPEHFAVKSCAPATAADKGHGLYQIQGEPAEISFILSESGLHI